jgi:hypothetical protein
VGGEPGDEVVLAKRVPALDAGSLGLGAELLDRLLVELLQPERDGSVGDARREGLPVPRLDVPADSGDGAGDLAPVYRDIAAGSEDIVALNIAKVSILLGDKDEAVRWVSQAVRNDQNEVIQRRLAIEPELRQLL